MFPDGEYVIAADSHSPDAEALAVRHGFVPDSMDVSAPQRFYRERTRCILVAQPASAANDHIYFEGKSIDVSKETEGYYLSVEQGPLPRVVLHKLDSSFRFAKARSVSALRAHVDSLEADSKKRNSASTASPRPVLAPSPEISGAAPAQILISDSDFDDLNSDLDECKFPEFPQFPVIDNNVHGNPSSNSSRSDAVKIIDSDLQNGNSPMVASPQFSKLRSKSAIKVPFKAAANSRSVSPAHRVSKVATMNSAKASSRTPPVLTSKPVSKSSPLSRPFLRDSRPNGLVLRSLALSKPKTIVGSRHTRARPSPSPPPIDDDFADLEDELHKVLESEDAGFSRTPAAVAKEESSSEED